MWAETLPPNSFSAKLLPQLHINSAKAWNKFAVDLSFITLFGVQINLKLSFIFLVKQDSQPWKS